MSTKIIIVIVLCGVEFLLLDSIRKSAIMAAGIRDQLPGQWFETGNHLSKMV